MHIVTDDSLNFSGFSAVGQLPTKGRQLRLHLGPSLCHFDHISLRAIVHSEELDPDSKSGVCM